MRTTAILFLIALTALASETNEFRAFIIARGPQPPVDASKASSITNGITLGQVVARLGPGWMIGSTNKSDIVDSAGIIKWSLSDGRQLNVWPDNNSASTVLTTNVHGDSRFWFSTNSFIRISK
jgi:hypothetical protein